MKTYNYLTALFITFTFQVLAQTPEECRTDPVYEFSCNCPENVDCITELWINKHYGYPACTEAVLEGEGVRPAEVCFEFLGGTNQEFILEITFDSDLFTSFESDDFRTGCEWNSLLSN